MKLAVVFPGQGAQAIGMGKDLAENFSVAKDVFATVNEALGEDLTKTMWDGPAEDLGATRNTQPALMAHSIAALRVLETETDFDLSKATFLAGHSLGEYSALCAAGVYALADTSTLLRLRGDSMQAAVPKGEGGMAAILGLDAAKIEEVLATENITDAQIANDNCPGQIVISGKAAAIEKAMAALKEAGAKRALPLAVSAPFHSQFMKHAEDIMQDALNNCPINTPTVPVMQNVTVETSDDPQIIIQNLVDQICGRVRWTETIQKMHAEGVTHYIEIGTGKVLSGLIKKIDRSANIQNFGQMADLEKLVIDF